ncbi:NTP transferase domain-containing protein [Oceanobacillus sp. 143]|nr:NTP transferase domain-containing protein [Oceanobacillus sp. 143]
MMNIYSIILAAGSSSRMGTHKQLLKLGEQTILEHVINLTITIEFSKIIAVIGNEKDRVRNQIFIDEPRFIWSVNEEYNKGQSTSIKTGIRTIGEEYVNVMIFLGDLPFIKKETAGRIYRAGLSELAGNTNPFIIQPVYKGMPGHPVFLAICLTSISIY